MFHNGRIFLSVLLISAVFGDFNAFAQQQDTLKKVAADTIRESVESLEEQVKYDAEDSVVALLPAGKAILYGKATVEYGSMKMKAAVMEIDYTANTVKAYGRRDSLGHTQGNPSFDDGGETMEADTIRYNLKTKKGKIYNALTKQGELLVVGNEIKKDSNDIIYMKNMKCIPCQEADARTVFRATKAKIIPDDKIVTGPMYLEIGGVPTPLGLPFGYFPNTKKQHDGILLPTFGSSPAFGFNLKGGGFYFGFSDKTDMIIRTNIFANGSWGVSTENNYKTLYKHNGTVFLEMNQFNTGEREIPDQFSTQRAIAVRWVHTQDNRSNPTSRFSADVNFRRNQQVNRLIAINSADFLQNTFQSNVSYSKTWRFGSLSLNGMHSQNSIDSSMTITLPSLTFNINRFYPFKRKKAVRPNVIDKIQAHYLMQFQNTLSGREDSIFTGNVLGRMRNGVRHSLPVSTNFSILRYITATPQLNLTSVMYAQTIRRTYDPELGMITRTVNVPSAGYDATFNTAFNTQVYFDYIFRGGKVKQIRHLMIPTVSYNYRPDFGAAHHGFWREVQADTMGRMTRYSIFERGVFGGPGQGELNGFSFNLNNNLEGKFRQITDTGVTFVKKTIIQNLTATGGYNFAADSFRLSDLGLSMRTVLFKYFDLVASSQFSPYQLDKTGTDVFGNVRPRVRNRYLWEDGRRLLRFADGNIAVNTALGSDMIEQLRKIRQPTDLSNAAERGGEVRTDDPVEKLPWTIRVGYNLRLVNPDDRKVLPQHQLSFSADFTPTKFWKVGVTSGYDFNAQQLSYTRVSVYRDLKCWEARIDWVPFGPAKSYNVSLNMKLSMLSEFRIPRQRQWYDNVLE